MKSAESGCRSSRVEIGEVTNEGFWLVADGERLYLPYEKFPWFRHVSREQLGEVKLWPPDHLQWERLDIDLCIDSIHHPEKYPLIAHYPNLS